MANNGTVGSSRGPSLSLKGHSRLIPNLFNAVVETADVLARLYMRAHAVIHPGRSGQTFFGAALDCDIRDFIQRRIYFFDVYEPNLTHLMMRMVRPGDTFVDVGANIGYFSLLGSKLVGSSGAGIAIEASPDTFKILKINLDRNGAENVRAVNLAATKGKCRVQVLRPDPRNTGKNAVKPVSAREYGEADGEPLDRILGPEIARVNFIKIDIEGSEGPVLQSILDNLARFPSRLAIVAEMAESSAPFVALFREAGLNVAGVPNVYKIGSFLARNYLAMRGEEGLFSATVPVERYSRRFTDYLFERC